MIDMTRMIRCDNCGKNISTTTKSGLDEYILSLDKILIHDPANISYEKGSNCIIDEQHHFCNIECLKEWAETIPYIRSMLKK
jgi:hypothetical protein